MRCTTLSIISVFLGSCLLCGPAAGEVLREWWLGVGGTDVSDLTSDSRYPYAPSGRDLLSSFDVPADWADNYGTRLRAYLVPPVTGEYTFWIASDDASELLLSSDADPANAVLVASVTTLVSSRYGWDEHASQRSAPLRLEAGSSYYIEALHKEGGGGDHVAVAWQNGGSRVVIPGEYLIPPQRFWDNDSGDDDWFNSLNWDPDGAPAEFQALGVHSGTPHAAVDVITDNGGSITIVGAETSATFDQRLYVGNTGTLNVDGQLSLGGTGTLTVGDTLRLDGGRIECGAFDNTSGGTFYFNGGTLAFLSNLAVDTPTPFNAAGVDGDLISSGRKLEVAGDLDVVGPNGTLTLDGGQIACGAFDNSPGGTFQWNSGTLGFSGDLAIDSLTPFGAVGGDAISAGRMLEVAGNLTVGPIAALTLEGGQIACGAFDNSAGGTFQWNSGTLGFSGNLAVESLTPFGAVGGDAISAGRMLEVAGNLTVGDTGTLTLDGGHIACTDFDKKR